LPAFDPQWHVVCNKYKGLETNERTFIMHAKTSLKHWLVAAALTAGASSTQAAVFLAVAGPGGTGNNLIFNACPAAVTGGGTTVTGCLNTDHNLLVDSTGIENLVVPSGGQASIQAADGSLTQLTIDPRNFTTEKIILNIFASANGFVTFNDATGSAATTLAITGSTGPRGNSGSNFYTLTGGDLDFITLAASNGISFSRVEQVRFDPTVVSAVPEPQEWAMLLGGLAVVSAIAKRRKAG
jgi:hypothetical protein